MDFTVLWNYCCIFIFPFLAGVIARSVFFKKEKGWLVPVVTAAIAVVMGIIALAVPNYGSEANGLLTIQAICLTVGALATGGVIRIVRRKRQNA